VKGFVLSIVATAIAFFVIATLLPDKYIDFAGETVALVLAALLVGLVNAVVKPVVKALSFPITMMTLGLFSFVINAAMVLLVALLAQSIDGLKLTIGGWPTDGFSIETIVGAFVVSIALSILTSIVGHFVHD
jgi:putative membrane protein